MSAVADGSEKAIAPIQVLFCLFPGFDTLDLCGPLVSVPKIDVDKDNKENIF